MNEYKKTEEVYTLFECAEKFGLVFALTPFGKNIKVKIPIGKSFYEQEVEKSKVICGDDRSLIVIHHAGGCDAEGFDLGLGDAGLFAQALAQGSHICHDLLRGTMCARGQRTLYFYFIIFDIIIILFL